MQSSHNWRRVMLVILLFLLLGCAIITPLGTPNIKQFNPPVAKGKNIICVENTPLFSNIYTINNNQLTNIYRELRIKQWQAWRIVTVAVEGNNTYLLRENQSKNNFNIVNLNEPNQNIATITFDSTQPVAMAIYEDVYYITTRSQDNRAFVYTFAGNENTLSLIIPAEQLTNVKTLSYDGTRFNATLNDGSSATISDAGVYSYSNSSAISLPRQLNMSTSIKMQTKVPALVFMAMVWMLIVLSILINQIVNRFAKHLATRITTITATLVTLAVLACNILLCWQLLAAEAHVLLLNFVFQAALASELVILLTIVLCRIITGRYAQPLSDMTKQMARIAEGNTTVATIDKGHDELHEMHQTIQELCVSLSIRDYEISCVSQTYGRFVPTGLTTLLNRATVSEVSPGDNRSITNCVGLFCVGNRSKVRNDLPDDNYATFIEQSLSMMEQSITKNNGYLLASGLNLAATKVFFPTAKSGVQAGLDFLGSCHTNSLSAIPLPDPFLLLHNANFLYGVVGNHDKLYPYLSCSELEFLGSFSDIFYKCGARLVFTNSYLQQFQEQPFVTRYIGFLSNSEKGCNYKLYEVLNAYHDMERNQRIRYDAQFQAALNLFYRNDFYLARNQFSSILRICPEDGIARWYLFACDYYFHQSGKDNINYSLFGVKSIID